MRIMFSANRMRRFISASILSTLCIFTVNVNAQLSKNPDKFLGNITTRYSMDVNGISEKYYQLWNQVTPENESKWGSVEGTRGRFNWGSDTPFNYAKQYGFTYKFHALVWGAQYPNWFTGSLPVDERYNAIVNWFNEVKKHYPSLPMIDVVNEAVGMHQQGNPLMKESLGGGGRTGYDWLIKAFELAHERWPDAILIYNDYNTFQWDTDNYIELVRTLRDAGAPIDAYGCQSHDLTDCDYSKFTAAEQKIQNALKMPMYITEYDIGTTDDELQEQRYREQIPYLWEKPYCAGITLWGYIYGATWTTDGNSGLIKDGADRPAMTWLRSYMKTDAAKTAKSPFPGMKKQISLYIKPATLKATRGDTLDITVRAQLVDKTKAIDSVKLFVNGKLDTIMTQAPYIAKYVPAANGKYPLKAIVYANDGNTYQREGSFTAYNPRSPFKSMSIPGTIQAEDFDKGGDGVTYHDSNSDKEGDGSSYRSDCEGVDIVNGNGGKAIGYTSTDEWLEYTVIVEKAGYYTYEAVASSGTTGSGFRLAVSDIDGITDLTENISVPQTASGDWGTYKSFTGRTLIPLKEGEQVIRLTITGNNCNIDKINFRHVEVDKTLNLRISANPSPATARSNATITFTPITSSRADAIAKVDVYINGSKVSTVTAKPFTYTYKPTAKGTANISAIATDTLGHESEISKFTLKINNPRSTYDGSIKVPGVLQFENFDGGGEDVSFHDSETEDKGEAGYRSDNGGVDIVTGNGGYAIGHTASGEWLEYTINVQTAGIYGYKATVSSGLDNSGFRIGIMNNGKETVLANIAVPNTGSWDTYRTLSTEVIQTKLEAGKQILRVTITGSYCNLDKIEFSCLVGVNYISDDDMKAPGTRYNLGGAIVGDDYKGIVIIDGKKVMQK